MRELVLLAILAAPAERSRGRHNPRVVKRKMSSFPTKARAAPPSGRVFRYEDHIRVVAPPDPPTERAPMPAASPEVRPKRCRPRKASAVRTDDRPSWLEQVRSWRASERPVARRLLRAPQPEPTHLPSLGGTLAAELQEARRALTPPSLSQRYWGYGPKLPS